MFRAIVRAAMVINKISNFNEIVNRVGKIADFGQ